MDPKKKYQKLVADAKAIGAAAKAESRDLTAEEVTQVNALQEQIDTLRAEIEQAEADAQHAARAAAALAALDADTFMDEPAAPPRSVAQPAAAGHITHQVDEIEKDPCRGFKSTARFLDAVRRADTAKANGGSLEKVHAANPGLNYLATAGSDEHGTFSDSYGGYLVPEGYSPDPKSITAESDPVAGLVTKIPMAFPKVNITARVDKTHTSSVSGGLRVYRRAEADTVASSQQSYEGIKLEANGLFGIAYATEELLTDSPISFAALLAAGFQDEFGSVILDERLNGTGVGQFLGINNSAALVSVAKESAQLATTIVYNNILNMRARVWGYGNAVWMANHDCIPQLGLLNQAVGTGGVPAWQPSAREDVPDMLFGRPLIFSEYMETLGTAGDIICANWTQYLEGVYQPLESAESIHVRFVNHERCFKFSMRNAGSPWWSSALTVKKGSNSLSPFVRLAVRS